MAGRHSAPGRDRPRAGSRALRRSRSRLLPAVLAAGAVGVGGFVVVGKASTEAAGCEGSVNVRIAAAPEIASVLGAAARALEEDGTAAGSTCIDYEVQVEAPQQVSETLAADPRKAPDLWVPDFSVWLTRAAQDGVTSDTIAKSLAKSPVVVVGRDVEAPSSWREVGMSTVAYLDPLISSASTAALLSAFGETAVSGASKAQLGAMMMPLARRYSSQPDKPTTVEGVAHAAEQGALAVMTEQQLVSVQTAGGGKGLSAAVPKPGTTVLDYPLAALSAAESAQQAGRQLAEYLGSSRGAELLSDNGFRDAGNTPLGSGAGLGKGEIAVLPAPDAATVSGVLQQWAVLTVPSRSLAVVDVSGSMDVTDAGRSRISLAVAAADGALKLFPDNAQIGLWAFSVGRGAGNRDYTSLLPIRTLGSTTPDGEPHRQALTAALRKLPAMTDGGTGLYDTTLAAIRAVQDDYDARAVNSVILLTDGENEDPGSLSMEELVETIERERDPARPVGVIAIGMGPEADAKALQRIASATGGRSYVARNPSDISKVFMDAMLAR